MPVANPTTETDIANLALQLIGEQEINDIDTDTSKVARVCAREFAVSRDRALRDHPWNFATKRAELGVPLPYKSGIADFAVGEEITVEVSEPDETDGRGTIVSKTGDTTSGTLFLRHVSGDFPPDKTIVGATTGVAQVDDAGLERPPYEWQHRYKLPDDYLIIVSFMGQGPGAPKWPYAIEGGYLLANLDQALIEYVAQTPDVTQWDSYFIKAFTLLLAAELVHNITGSRTKRGELIQEYEVTLKDFSKRKDANESRGNRRRNLVYSESVRSRITPWYGRIRW